MKILKILFIPAIPFYALTIALIIIIFLGFYSERRKELKEVDYEKKDHKHISGSNDEQG